MAKRKTFTDYVLKGGIKGKFFVTGKGSSKGEVYYVRSALRESSEFTLVFLGEKYDCAWACSYSAIRGDKEATVREVMRAREGKLAKVAKQSSKKYLDFAKATGRRTDLPRSPGVYGTTVIRACDERNIP